MHTRVESQDGVQRGGISVARERVYIPLTLRARLGQGGEAERSCPMWRRWGWRPEAARWIGVVAKPWTALWTSRWTTSCPPLATQAAHRFPTTSGMDHNNNFLLKGGTRALVNTHTRSGSAVFEGAPAYVVTEDVPEYPERFPAASAAFTR